MICNLTYVIPEIYILLKHIFMVTSIAIYSKLHAYYFPMLKLNRNTRFTYSFFLIFITIPRNDIVLQKVYVSVFIYTQNKSQVLSLDVHSVLKIFLQGILFLKPL